MPPAHDPRSRHDRRASLCLYRRQTFHRRQAESRKAGTWCGFVRRLLRRAVLTLTA